MEVALRPSVSDPGEAGHHRTRFELLQLPRTRSASFAGVGLDEPGAPHFGPSSSARALRLVPRAPLANLAVHRTVHVAPLLGRRRLCATSAIARKYEFISSYFCLHRKSLPIVNRSSVRPVARHAFVLNSFSARRSPQWKATGPFCDFPFVCEAGLIQETFLNLEKINNEG